MSGSKAFITPQQVSLLGKSVYQENRNDFYSNSDHDLRRIVVILFTISAYHPLICEFEPRSWRGELDKIFRKMGTTIILIQIMTLGELLLSCLVTSFSFLSSQILKLFVFPMFWLLLSQTKLITCRNAWCTFH